MEEASIQYIPLLLIVAIFHSSPPSFQTAGIVTQLQQCTCLEDRVVTLLGLISLSLQKLCCSAGLFIIQILLWVFPALGTGSRIPIMSQVVGHNGQGHSQHEGPEGQLHEETLALLILHPSVVQTSVDM